MDNLIWQRLAIGASGCTWEASIVDNVRRLAPYVDNIEIIVYEYENLSNYPGPADLREMAELALQFDCSYTVHLPASLSVHPLHKSWQRQALDEWSRAVETLSCLSPRAYVWHWESEILAQRPSADLGNWLEVTEQMAQAFLDTGLLQPDQLCVENLEYDYALILPLIRRLGLSVCLDVGHAWKNGSFTPKFWNEIKPELGAVHLHGVQSRSGLDHIAIQPENRSNLRAFSTALVNFLHHNSKFGQTDEAGRLRKLPLTLEVFSPTDWQRCLNEFCLSHSELAVSYHPKLAAFTGF
ncbi:MAG: cobamide remodeling phosphodiesterase CbiR [Candidatus Bruticola sp.]